MKVFVAIVIVGSVAALLGACAASERVSTQAQVRGLCGAAPIQARQLRVPQQPKSCQLVGRTVIYYAAQITVPPAGKARCVTAGRRSAEYRLCISTQGLGTYAFGTTTYRPAACRRSGDLPAALLRVPVRRSACDLVGRHVTFSHGGLYVPKSGTVCEDAYAPPRDYELCVTRDRFSVWSTTSVD
jgi:hypothetical protein